MAYRRNYRKKIYKKSTKSPWYSKKYSALQMAQKALSGIKAIRGIINSELHITDTTPIIDQTVSTEQVRHMTAVPIDDLKSGRTGNSILLKSIHIKGFIDWDLLNSNYDGWAHILLIKDNRQIKDTLPTYADFFTTGLYGFTNTNNNSRYTILAQKTFIQNVNIGKPMVNLYHKTNFHVKYNGTASTDIDQNGIYLMCISNQTTNAPSIALNSRVTFYDN